MKMNILALLMGLLCYSALAQSPTLTGFNGRINFSSFANNGLYVRGTLKDFSDQTGQYICSQIAVNDIVWDNNGKRYAVAAVISSNATQAVVDLSRIGGGTHIPKGAGFVSRETSNGLALIPPVNSAGIGTQLASRAGVHNMKILEGLKTIYSGSDSIRVPNILVKMAANGSQNLGIGYFPNFPDYNNNTSFYGLFISPSYYGELSLMYSRNDGSGRLNVYNNSVSLSANSASPVRYGLFSVYRGLVLTTVGSPSINDKYWNIVIDTSKFQITRNISGTLRTYELLPASQYPITNPDAISTLSWISGTPSFIRSQHAVVSGTTDGSGDITITFPASMPDVTYTVLVTGEGSTLYHYMTQPATKSIGSVKVRMFNTAGIAATATAYQISYEIKDN